MNIEEIFKRFPEVKEEFYQELTKKHLELVVKAQDSDESYHKNRFDDIVRDLKNIMKFDPKNRTFNVSERDLATHKTLWEIFNEK